MDPRIGRMDPSHPDYGSPHRDHEPSHLDQGSPHRGHGSLTPGSCIPRTGLCAPLTPCAPGCPRAPQGRAGEGGEVKRSPGGGTRLFHAVPDKVLITAVVGPAECVTRVAALPWKLENTRCFPVGFCELLGFLSGHFEGGKGGTRGAHQLHPSALTQDRLWSGHFWAVHATPAPEHHRHWSVRLAVPVLAGFNRNYSLVPDLNLSCDMSTVDMDNISLST